MNHGCQMPGNIVLIKIPARSTIAHKHISLFDLLSTNPQVSDFSASLLLRSGFDSGLCEMFVSMSPCFD